MRRVRRLSPAEAPAVRELFLPERPGPLIGLHVLQTGIGQLYVDRFPSSQAVLAEVSGNLALYGAASALSGDDLRRQSLDGFVETPATFEPLLRQAYPGVGVWRRVIQRLDPTRLTDAPQVAPEVRPLEPADLGAVRQLSLGLAWIADTWDGPAGLVASGRAWGAFVGRRPVSLACSFFVGEHFEDVGIVTEPEFRGRCLAQACAHAVCADIIRRGRTPSWSTSPDNLGSLRVAQKLGFRLDRHDRLLVVGRPIP